MKGMPGNQVHPINMSFSWWIERMLNKGNKTYRIMQGHAELPLNKDNNTREL